MDSTQPIANGINICYIQHDIYTKQLNPWSNSSAMQLSGDLELTVCFSRGDGGFKLHPK